jgi:hypothetical protein
MVCFLLRNRYKSRGDGLESGIAYVVSIEFPAGDLVCQKSDELEEVFASYFFTLFSRLSVVRNAVFTNGFSGFTYIYPFSGLILP